jgi:hypothetical protein
VEKQKKRGKGKIFFLSPSSLAACIRAFCACAAAFASAPSLGAGGESSFFPATWNTSQTASMASCEGSSPALLFPPPPPPPWTLPNSPSKS